MKEYSASTMIVLLTGMLALAIGNGAEAFEPATSRCGGGGLSMQADASIPRRTQMSPIQTLGTGIIPSGGPAREAPTTSMGATLVLGSSPTMGTPRSRMMPSLGTPQQTESGSGVMGGPSTNLVQSTSRTRYGPAAAPSLNAVADEAPTGWLERLTSLSNVASLLCAVDCTVLPLVSLLLPLFGFAAGGSGDAFSAALHGIGHSVALRFVLPVGTLAAATAYLGHRDVRLTTPNLLGLLLVFVSNAGGGCGCAHGHALTLGPTNPLRLLPHAVVSALNSAGWMHRTANVLGCALMLGGNYLSKRAAKAAGRVGCGFAWCRREDCEEVAGPLGDASFFQWNRADSAFSRA